MTLYNLIGIRNRQNHGQVSNTYDKNLIFFDKNMIDLCKFSGMYPGEVVCCLYVVTSEYWPWHPYVTLRLWNTVRDFISVIIILFQLYLRLDYRHQVYRVHFCGKCALDFDICNLRSKKTASSKSGVPRPTACNASFSKIMCLLQFE
jgi:hypothetical protein